MPRRVGPGMLRRRVWRRLHGRLLRQRLVGRLPWRVRGRRLLGRGRHGRLPRRPHGSGRSARSGYPAGPGPGAAGTDTFTYRASDGVAQSAPATVTITLTAPQTGPDAVNDAFTVVKRRHRAHILNVLGNDSAGPGGGTVKVVAVTQPQHGHVHIAPAGRAVVFQAPKRFRGLVTFTYTIRNAGHLTDTATVTVLVKKRHGPHVDDDDDPDDDDGDCDGRDHHDGD